MHVQALLSMCAQPAEDGQMEMYWVKNQPSCCGATAGFTSSEVFSNSSSYLKLQDSLSNESKPPRMVLCGLRKGKEEMDAP